MREEGIPFGCDGVLLLANDCLRGLIIVLRLICKYFWADILIILNQIKLVDCML